MKQITGWAELREADRGAGIALGNFDGLHHGHRAVLDAAGQGGAPLGAAIFAPHPRRYFAPDSPPFRLSSDRVRAELLAEAGVRTLYTIPFDDTLRRMSPEAFARDILSDGLGAARVAVGEDFRFGQDRAGDIHALKGFGARFSFDVAAVPPVEAAGGPASSTRIREALRSGELDLANRILGHEWRMDGEVIEGDRLGRTLGWPTANMALGDYIRPAFGIYAVRCRIEGEADWRPGVASLGTRPTVEGKDERLEVFLFDFEGDLYGKRLETAFSAFLRPEEKFDSLDAMKLQMEKDAKQARARLA